VGVLILDDVAGMVSFLAPFLALLVVTRLLFQTFVSFWGGGFFWGYHLERGRKIHVKCAKKYFETIKDKIDNRIVHFVPAKGYFAFFQPNLVVLVKCQEEFGRKFFVEVFNCLESQFVPFHLQGKGPKTLGSDAESSEENFSFPLQTSSAGPTIRGST
jgi:hypothetical protein